MSKRQWKMKISRLSEDPEMQVFYVSSDHNPLQDINQSLGIYLENCWDGWGFEGDFFIPMKLVDYVTCEEVPGD